MALSDAGGCAISNACVRPKDAVRTEISLDSNAFHSSHRAPFPDAFEALESRRINPWTPNQESRQAPSPAWNVDFHRIDLGAVAIRFLCNSA